MPTRIATWIIAKRIPLVPSPIAKRLLDTPPGRRASRSALAKKLDAKTMPRGH